MNLKKMRNIAVGAFAVAAVGALSVFISQHDRENVDISGTVKDVTHTTSAAGTTLDRRQPVVLEDGSMLVINPKFKGDIEIGRCYNFKAFNLIGAPAFQGLYPQIVDAKPCPQPK